MLRRATHNSSEAGDNISCTFLNWNAILVVFFGLSNQRDPLLKELGHKFRSLSLFNFTFGNFPSKFTPASHSPTIIVETNEFMNATCASSSSDKLVPLKESDKLPHPQLRMNYLSQSAYKLKKNVRKCFTSHTSI